MSNTCHRGVTPSGCQVDRLTLIREGLNLKWTTPSVPEEWNSPQIPEVDCRCHISPKSLKCILGSLKLVRISSRSKQKFTRHASWHGIQTRCLDDSYMKIVALDKIYKFLVLSLFHLRSSKNIIKFQQHINCVPNLST